MRWAVAVAVVAMLGVVSPTDTQKFTDWSPPENLGPVVNSDYVDSCVAISKNGLSLFFSSTRQNPTVNSNRDLYVSQRETVDAPWGVPQPLSAINTSAWESCPALSPDEHRLYFSSPRTGTCGGQDIWVSRRQDRRDDFAWEPPVNLGCEPDGPNSPAGDQVPTLFENEDGRVVMYFGSYRSANWDHYQTEMRADDTFGPATPVAELNSTWIDQGITVRRDGREVFFLSDRPPGGSEGSLDFWAATRHSTKEPWSAPTFVPSLGNPAWAQGRISLSFDGREMYFTSWNEPFTGPYGWPDLWVARRDKVGGKPRD